MHRVEAGLTRKSLSCCLRLFRPPSNKTRTLAPTPTKLLAGLYCVPITSFLSRAFYINDRVSFSGKKHNRAPRASPEPNPTEMAWKHDLLLLAAFWSILVQPTPIEPEVVPQVTPTPAMPRLSPVLHLENPQATLAPTSHLTASAATFKLSSSFPFATPRVYLRAVTSPECYYPDVSELSLTCPFLPIFPMRQTFPK